MKYLNIEQQSQSWFEYRAGKISGTRLGQVLSSRKNNLIYEMANERIDGFVEPSDFITEDMQFGVDNESEAIDKYEVKSGLKFIRGGVMQSSEYDVSMASPDGITADFKKVIEVKCTRSGAVQLRRYKEGVDGGYIFQIVNYFVVHPELEEVRWVSYAPFRFERPIVEHILKRDTIIDVKTYKTKPDVTTTVQDMVDEALRKIPLIDKEVDGLIKSFQEIKF